jgi:hypothetical protein
MIRTYFISHTISITQEIPARSKKGALKIYNAFIKEQPGVWQEVVTAGCTSTSSTRWEIEAHTSDEFDFYEPAIDQKMTADDILNWHGSDHGIEELAEILADIANGKYKLKDFRAEVNDYNAG